MNVHHLSCGTLLPVAGKLLNPKAQLACHCLLLEAADTLVLVDSGVGTADMAHPSRLGPMSLLLGLRRDPAETALRQIERLGYRPDDVGHIVITHLDLDHAGGLPDFPKAKVHVLRPEYEAAMGRHTFHERSRYRPCHWAHSPQWMIHERPCGEPWYGFDCMRNVDGLPPEIVLVPLPGHTKGHCGVAVQTDDTWLLHCGDLYYDHREVAQDPRTTTLFRVFQLVAHLDRHEAYQNQGRIRELTRRHGAEVRVFCTHDPEEVEIQQA